MVFSSWKGRQYVRRHVIPSNPNSLEQQSTRGAFRVANDIWKAAGSLLIAPWDAFASGQVLTGRNAFMGSFVRTNRGEADLAAMIFSPGAKGGLAPTDLSLAEVTTQITATVTPPTPPTGWTLQAAVAAAIADDDPDTMTNIAMVAAEDLSAPYEVVLAGLTDDQPYRVGAWLRWLKPDGSIAYGASINDVITPVA
jgi:hypothetical protein